MEHKATRWWSGSRGEWYVVGQLLLMALLFFGPRSAFGVPLWPEAVRRFVLPAGIVLMIAGGALLVIALIRLGSNLTPLPYPNARAPLVQTGAYGIVRHPMYAGGIVLSFGWALVAASWLTLAWAVILFVFLDVKSRREEKWLVETYPEYTGYQRRVRRLVPFVY